RGVFADRRRNHGCVELIGLLAAVLDDRVEGGRVVNGGHVRETQTEHLRRAGRDGEGVVRGGLGSRSRRVHGVAAALNQIFVKRVLRVGGCVWAAAGPPAGRL